MLHNLSTPTRPLGCSRLQKSRISRQAKFKANSPRMQNHRKMVRLSRFTGAYAVLNLFGTSIYRIRMLSHVLSRRGKPDEHPEGSD
jgi:hypothetical protein